MAEHFIALDVHCAFSEMAAMTRTGKVVQQDRCETKIRDLVRMLSTIGRPRRLTFEEGPMADWLARELRRHVDELVVCEPRRNHWIARDGDKDDPIDARKLADLYRGGYLKPVHQPLSLQRSLLKQQVLWYHDRVRERVRQGHQLTALLRRHGVFVRVSNLLDEEEWQICLARLPRSAALVRGLERVRRLYTSLLQDEEALRVELVGAARNFDPVRRFQALPGIGWIRGVTFYALIDTPHRFRSKAALWRYAGIGLERRHSGRGPVRTRLSSEGHRRLKDVLLGAAKTAIELTDNPFAEKYLYWSKEQGLHPANAKRNVARALAAAMWSLWKSGQTYEPERVRPGGVLPTTT